MTATNTCVPTHLPIQTLNTPKLLPPYTVFAQVLLINRVSLFDLQKVLPGLDHLQVWLFFVFGDQQFFNWLGLFRLGDALVPADPRLLGLNPRTVLRRVLSIIDANLFEYTSLDPLIPAVNVDFLSPKSGLK